jgi:hypothetical protein
MSSKTPAAQVKRLRAKIASLRHLAVTRQHILLARARQRRAAMTAIH